MGLVLAALLIPVWLHSEQQRIEAVAARESHALLAAENAIQALFRERIGDATVLLRSSLIGDFLDHPDAVRRRRLSGLLEAYCESYAEAYRQLSLVGLDGREWVRVDRSSGRCAEVPSGDLHDLAGRADFQATIQRQGLAIHASPWAIDQKGSEAGGGQALILRFVARVPDVRGTARALLILDSEAHNLLDQLLVRGVEGSMAPPVSHLLDAQGHYLKSTEAAGHGDGVASGRIRNRFDLDHPQVWRAIHEGRARLRTADGLYLLKSVHTLISAPVAAGTPLTSETDDQPWRLVRFIPESSLLATSLPHSPVGKFGLLGYAILIVFLGGMLAMARLRRIASASLQGAQAALMAAPAGILVVDEHGFITLANREAASLSGYPRDELEGQEVERLIPGSACALHSGQARSDRLPSAHGTGAGQELQALRQDGARFWLTFDWNRLKNRDHNRQFVICVIRDITEQRRTMREERDGAQRLQLAIDAANLGLWEWNVKTNHIRWDSRMFAIYGVQPTPNGLVDYRDWSTAVIPEELAEQERVLRETVERRGRSTRKFRIRRRDDGAERVIEAVETVRLDEDNRVEWVVGTNLDVSEREQADQALRDSEERYRMLFNQTADAILIVDLDGYVLAVNDQACRQYGYSREHWRNLHLTQIDTPEDAANISQRLETLKQAGYAAFQASHRDSEGRILAVDVRATMISYDGKPAMFSFCRDITEQKAARERIEYLAFHDSLTELPNRLLAQDYLTKAVAIAQRRQSRLAVLEVDIHRLRDVNDTHGWDMGDLLLRRIAQRLTLHLRAEDTLARLSSDEFLIIMSNIEAGFEISQIAAICERLLGILAQPFDLKGWQVEVSTPIGVALYPQDGANAETLLQNAGIAHRESKRLGPQRYSFFEPSMNVRLMHHLHLREALRKAIANQEFELHYQPQIDLGTSKVIGVEALVRWRRNDDEPVRPHEFIQVAEDSGLIVPIGHWVLREAIRQAAEWQRRNGWTLMMAVNLSAVQFRGGKLGQEVLSLLAEHQLNPASLELELTESLLLEAESDILDAIALWKSRGIKLSIDDFGTGYSSLVYLKRFQIDKIKLDQSFVSNIPTHEVDRVIVQSIIRMARDLNLQTIAEGVEDAGLPELLLSMGCDQAQGYLYAKPMPANGLETWFKQYSPSQYTGSVP